MYLKITPKLARVLCTFSDKELDELWQYLSETREVIQAIADGKPVEEHNPKTNEWEITEDPSLISKCYVRIANNTEQKE